MTANADCCCVHMCPPALATVVSPFCQHLKDAEVGCLVVVGACQAMIET